MAGNKIGGQRAAKTNKEKYGESFYKHIGALGGAKGHTGGFYVNRELAREAGAKGGRISKRPKKTTNMGGIDAEDYYEELIVNQNKRQKFVMVRRSTPGRLTFLARGTYLSVLNQVHKVLGKK